LLGGAAVRARPDVLIGEPWNGDYCVRPRHTVAWPSGGPRDQLQPLTLDKPRACLDARSATVNILGGRDARSREFRGPFSSRPSEEPRRP
jgi:hypothetical protein